MDEEYEGEANADLTLGILSKARNRPNAQLALSPETQAFFVSEEEPQEIIELISSDGDDDNSDDTGRWRDGGTPTASPKRRKIAPNHVVQGDASDPVTIFAMSGEGKSSKRKKRSKKSAQKERRRNQDEKEKPGNAASPAAGDPEEETPIAKKVSRGRRYFDPPQEAQKCFRCNEVGHFAAECTKFTQKCHKCGEAGHRKISCPSLGGEKSKPCCACGGSHSSKDCKLRVMCTHCEEFWHQSKDCPLKGTPRVCSLCGDPAHPASSCSKFFFPDDLKEVQCYVCRELGHLCCVDGLENFPQQPSCYNCGESGHTGITCDKPISPPEKKKEQVDNTPSKKCSECKLRKCICVSCYKCGQVGHFARECKKREARRMNEEENFSRGDYSNSKRRRPEKAETPIRLPKWYEVEGNKQR